MNIEYESNPRNVARQSDPMTMREKICPLLLKKKIRSVIKDCLPYMLQRRRAARIYGLYYPDLATLPGYRGCLQRLFFGCLPFGLVRRLKGLPCGGDEAGIMLRSAPRQFSPHDPSVSSLEANLNILRYIRGVSCDAKVTVIVPVYNQPELLRKCAESLLRHTPEDVELCFIDDCSPDPQIGVLLREFQERAPHRVTVLVNDRNLGFPGTCNRGIEHAKRRDVVLLNSDTMVTPRWLDVLRITAYGDPHVGTVSAVSNNSGFVSVPVPREAGYSHWSRLWEDRMVIPSQETVDQIGRAYLHCREVTCDAPTGHGFCLYIKRTMLDETGLLDQESFQQGYGEEVDLCLRAYRMGWMHRVTSRSFVWHYNAASFGESKREFVSRAGEIIRQRYPEFEFRKETAKVILREKMAVFVNMQSLFKGNTPIRPRLLFILGVRSGGTYWTNLDLMRNIRDRYDPFLLLSNGRTLELYDFSNRDGRSAMPEGGRMVASHELNDEFTFFDGCSDEMDRVILYWIVCCGIELVHARHLAHFSTGFLEGIHRLHVPIIFSFHDFFSISPTVKLVDWKGVFHPEGIRDGITRPDPVVLTSKRPIPLPGIDDGIAARWKELYQKTVFPYCCHFVTTCDFARTLLMEHFPYLAEKSSVFTVIPHGRDITPHDYGKKMISPTEPVKLLFLGSFATTKGGGLVIKVADSDTENRLQFHLVGRVRPELQKDVNRLVLAGKFVLHGQYSRGEEGNIVKDIVPHMGILPSVWPETWCHTLTECWAMGIPVFTFDTGALGERMKHVGGGWLMSLTSSPEEITREIVRISGNLDEYTERRNAVLRWQTGIGIENTAAKMADCYKMLYEQALKKRNE